MIEDTTDQKNCIPSPAHRGRIEEIFHGKENCNRVDLNPLFFT